MRGITLSLVFHNIFSERYQMSLFCAPSWLYSAMRCSYSSFPIWWDFNAFEYFSRKKENEIVCGMWCHLVFYAHPQVKTSSLISRSLMTCVDVARKHKRTKPPKVLQVGNPGWAHEINPLKTQYKYTIPIVWSDDRSSQKPRFSRV